MISIKVENLEDDLAQRLRQRAEAKGISVEEEVKEILAAVLSGESMAVVNLAYSIRAKFTPFGGVELDLPERSAIRDAPQFS